jgi:hypothetical protein
METTVSFSLKMGHSFWKEISFQVERCAKHTDQYSEGFLNILRKPKMETTVCLFFENGPFHLI